MQTHLALRPRTQPARHIYDTFQAEAELRGTRHFSDWLRLEQAAVHRAATSYAKEHGLRAPSIEEVEAAERYARAARDYAEGWSRLLAQLMMVEECLA